MIIEEKVNLENFLEIQESNIYHNNRYFAKKISNLRDLYEICLRYSIPFFKNDDLLYYSNKKHELASIIFENNNSLITLIDGLLVLNENANYLSVNILQRSVFEFLIVNNHLILTRDKNYIEKWINGKDVKIVKNILKKTDNSKQKELIDFWVVLSKINHASATNTQSEFDWSSNYGNHIDSMFFTYLLLYFYNYQLRNLYFPYMQDVYKEHNYQINQPFKSDWFLKKDKIKELEKSNNNDKLFELVEAFKIKWSLKED